MLHSLVGHRHFSSLPDSSPPPSFLRLSPSEVYIGKTYGCAGLDKVLAHRCPVVHGIERGHLVDSHWRHLKDACDFVHDADAGETMLALAEIKQRHHGGLLVLWRVSLEDLGYDGLILGCEFERDGGVVVGCVSVLFEPKKKKKKRSAGFL